MILQCTLGLMICIPFVCSTKVHLELDNRMCQVDFSKDCFETVLEAAEFLAAAYSHNPNSEELSGLYAVETDISKIDSETPSNPNLVYLYTGGLVLVVVVITIGVLLTSKRKRRGTTWLPEGFKRTKVSQPKAASGRVGPDGQELR